MEPLLRQYGYTTKRFKTPFVPICQVGQHQANKMEYKVKVSANKEEAFRKMLDNLKALDVIESYQTAGKKQKENRDKDSKKEKSTDDFAQQYRDLVD